jgi:uracil phosphoribosyltransferase
MQTTILSTPYNLSLLAQLGSAATVQPQISKLVEEIFGNMFGVIVDRELAKEKVAIRTRIYKKTKEGVFRGEIIKRKQKAVVADVIRGGMLPANLFYLRLCELLEPALVRQDHIMSQRVETPNGVTGTSLMSSKIGGSVKDAVVFIPDPMGATGHSIEEVVRHYVQNFGKPKKFVVVNLVVAPNYLVRLQKIKGVELHVYAARKDKKLTQDDYIVPGLGGVGEMINNTKK